MKIFLHMILLLLQLPANGYAQHITVNIKQNNISLEQLFREIEQQTNLKFVYRNERLSLALLKKQIGIFFTKNEWKSLRRCKKGN